MRLNLVQGVPEN